VAQRARLKQAGLVMERRSAWRTAKARLCVALQAHQINVAQLQHVRIRSAVDTVTGLATVHLDGRVLVYKRSLLVGVAFEADSILAR